MTAVELLAKLYELGVSLAIDGDQLRYSAPKGILTPDLRAEVLAHKTELVNLLGGLHGQIARAVLSAPQDTQSAFTPPQTPTENKLVQIWSQVLHISEIGVHNNFFELGGDSLLAMQVVASADQSGLRLHPTDIFRYQTIAELALIVDDAYAVSKDETLNGFHMPPLRRADRIAPLALSLAQQRLWILNQLEPERATAYNIPSISRLVGSLNVGALEWALTEIIRRHEVLRTSFPTVNGEPTQLIAIPITFRIKIIDLQNLPKSESERCARKIVAEETDRPFDLSTGPLFRAVLVELASDEHILAVTMHHMVTDGWSMAIFKRELAQLYNAFCHGQPSPLPELTIQYADYALWQREWLRDKVLETHLACWKRQLGDVPPVLELPMDRPRPVRQSGHGARQQFHFAKTLSDRLIALARHENVTLFILLLAAFQTLLYRYTGQDDFCVGTPIAGRTNTEISSLIGFFVNTSVLRTQFGGNPSFVELLQRVRQTTLDAYVHQDVPFEQLVDLLQPRRDVSNSPLFQVMFAFQNLPQDEISDLQWSGLTRSLFLVPSIRAAMFDLTLYVWDTSHGLQGTAEYDPDLFDDTTINKMLKHFEVLLEGIASDPQQKVSLIPLLTEAERHQLLFEWNDTKIKYPQDMCLHELFEEQVKLTPNAVAVVFENQQLTYKELNERSNQLAHYLRKLGVGPETLVGVYMERSLEMVIGLLSILKAGGAYVPLDPALPIKRLEFMLQDTDLSVVITQQSRLLSLQMENLSVVGVDRDKQAIHLETTANPLPSCLPGNLAYVIYTSGSTGMPKGVQVTHHSVVNFLTGVQGELKLTAEDTLLSITTLSFDIAALELYLPLMVGAKVLLANQTEVTDGHLLLSRLKEGHVTVMQATPSSWQILLLAGWQGTPGLKMLCGGENLSRDLALQLMDKGDTLWNLYGPTETTIWSTAHRVIHADGAIPIGRPIANTKIYLLDSQLQPVPVGVPGNLYIGGDGLSRGYLGRPELSQEQFIPNPFSDNPGERLYKTGDLARYLPDGNIIFLGRTDHQFKIRGYRIEPGEVAAALQQHINIKDAVVIAREDVPGNKQLVAYLVANCEPTPSISALCNYLKEMLPVYMVPSTFVFVPSIPLTPNRKIDRNALPVPDHARPSLEEEYIAPQTLTEEKLMQIWSQVLGIKQVGIHDNFFELGGHSLNAVQVLYHVGVTFKVNLPLRNIFDFPTIYELAKQLDCQKVDVDDTSLPQYSLTKLPRTARRIRS